MRDFSDFVVSPRDSIRTAMERITKNRHRVVIVVDHGRVVGTVSDGDIRRAMLREVLALAPVRQIMNINCRTITATTPEKQRDDLRRAHVTVLPVVNDRDELIDIVLAFEA